MENRLLELSRKTAARWATGVPGSNWGAQARITEQVRAAAKQPHIGRIVDGALQAIETGNPSLQGKLDRRFGRAQVEPGRMGELMHLVSTTGFGDHRSAAKDVLGEVYEHFLGQFATAEAGCVSKLVEIGGGVISGSAKPPNWWLEPPRRSRHDRGCRSQQAGAACL